jgi:hypothetical protein
VGAEMKDKDRLDAFWMRKLLFPLWAFLSVYPGLGTVAERG